MRHCKENERMGYEISIIVTDTESKIKKVCIGTTLCKKGIYIYQLCQEIASDLIRCSPLNNVKYLKYIQMNTFEFKL